jgi:hypothetical protein
MTLYKCHHIQDTIILDDNIISYLAYLDWAESVGINGTKELCWDCWNEKNCKIDSQENKMENSGNGHASFRLGQTEPTGSPDKILNWSTYCATTNNRNQCSKETCTIFPICKIKEVRE